jgi:hypothetical protein
MEIPATVENDAPLDSLDPCLCPSHQPTTRGFALPVLEPDTPLQDQDHDDDPFSSSPPTSDSDSKAALQPAKMEAYLVLPNPTISLPPTSAGGMGALAGAKTGAFELLADASGALVRKSGSQVGFVAPFDAVGVFICPSCIYLQTVE